MIQKGQQESAKLALASIRGEKDFAGELKAIEDEVQANTSEHKDLFELLQSPPVRRALLVGCVLQVCPVVIPRFSFARIKL